MGNVSGSDELVTKQDLKAFYQAILPYLSNGSGGTTYTAGDGIDIINNIISTKQSASGDLDEVMDVLPTGGNISVCGHTPLGTIISYYGETAPRFYLACDGSEYNKSDYPELANHLLSLTNHSQYEVSGDDTKFKVPDLRGEFLRGTGTNSHTMGGTGASVGVHQAPTKHKRMCMGGSASNTFIVYSDASDNSNSWINNSLDEDAYTTSIRSKDIALTNWVSNTSNAGRFTSRPTNTAVLYCIAYKDIYTNPMNDYSTDEKIVGTWIDGKPLYQKTIQITGNFTGLDILVYDLSSWGINTIIKVDACQNIHTPGSYGTYPSAAPSIGNNQAAWAYTYYIANYKIYTSVGASTTVKNPVFTIQYTKTTD